MDEPQISLRDSVARLLKAEKPDIDVDDDVAFYTQIIDDYADYARLLTADYARQDADKAREQLRQESMQRLGSEYSEAELSEAVKLIDDMAAARDSGSYDSNAIRLALCALHHDADVAKAREDAIDEVLSPRTDGVPHLTGACSGFPAAGNSIFDIARGA